MKKSIKERAAFHRLQSTKKIFHVFSVVFLHARVTFLFLVCERCICLENIKLCHRSCESGVTWATFAEATAHSLKFHLYRSWLFFSAFCNSSWGNTEMGKKKRDTRKWDQVENKGERCWNIDSDERVSRRFYGVEVIFTVHFVHLYLSSEILDALGTI